MLARKSTVERQDRHFFWAIRKNARKVTACRLQTRRVLNGREVPALVTREKPRIDKASNTMNLGLGQIRKIPAQNFHLAGGESRVILALRQECSPKKKQQK